MIKRHPNFLRRNFVKFLCVIGFFWVVFLLYATTWNSQFSNIVNQKFYDIDVDQIIQDRIVELVVERDLVSNVKENSDEKDFDYEMLGDDVAAYDDDDNLQNSHKADEKIQSAEELVSIKAQTRASTTLPMKPTLSPEILSLHARLNLTNPGRMGEAVILPEFLEFDIERMLNKSKETFQINEFVSNLIPLDRALPDVRTDYCKDMTYSSQLPVASIIMVFHNEALSMIMRTIYSIINRSREDLLGEIILVDDCSSIENLKIPLKELVAKFPKVRVLRSPTRIGLIRARMMGAVNAEGPALIFMDAHMECTEGWLEPLLDRLAINKNTTAISVVDTISMETLEYRFTKDPSRISVTGFDWNLMFNWKPIPEHEIKRRKNPNEPIYSPTMLGAFFVIDKEYFELLGMYDEEFDIWGAENLELAFKVWLCGGQVEVIPCSHVGHLFRKKFPYSWPRGSNVVWKNTDRLAEVWLDEYKRFYHRKMGIRTSFGDVSKQKKLREDLKCKPFRWFIENVYPDVVIPEELQDKPPSVQGKAQVQDKPAVEDKPAVRDKPQVQDKPSTLHQKSAMLNATSDKPNITKA